MRIRFKGCLIDHLVKNFTKCQSKPPLTTSIFLCMSGTEMVDPCLYSKWPCFGGLKPKNRGQRGSRCIYSHSFINIYIICIHNSLYFNKPLIFDPLLIIPIPNDFQRDSTPSPPLPELPWAPPSALFQVSHLPGACVEEFLFGNQEFPNHENQRQKGGGVFFCGLAGEVRWWMNLQKFLMLIVELSLKCQFVEEFKYKPMPEATITVGGARKIV